MKQISGISAFVAFMIYTNFTQGQIMDSTVVKMLDVQVINPVQAQKLDQMLQEIGGGQRPSFYLYNLMQLQHFSAIESLSDSLINYLKQLRSCNLITDLQFAKHAEKVRQKEYKNNKQLLAQLYQQSAYDEAISPGRLLEFGRRLLASDILTPASFETLQKDIIAEKIDAPAQLIRYCQHARVFHLMDYMEHPAESLEGIFREVSTIFPELTFTDYRQSEVVDPYPYPTIKKIQVTLKANGMTYKTEVHLLGQEMKPDGSFTFTISQQGFCKVFNEMLTDVRSPWRLHEITSSYLSRSSSLYHFLGTIALKITQTESFGAINDLLKISGAVYRNALTTDQIDAAISAYRTTDLLNHIGAAEAEAVRNKAIRSGIQHYTDLLGLFPDVVFIYEPTIGNQEEKPYTRLLLGYAGITRGAFVPTDIEETASAEEDGPTTLRFRFKDKTYEQVLKKEYSHVSPDYYQLIESISSELPGKFYLLYDARWRSAIIYLQPEQYDFLAAGGFVISQLDGFLKEGEE